MPKHIEILRYKNIEILQYNYVNDRVYKIKKTDCKDSKTFLEFIKKAIEYSDKSKTSIKSN